jgi:hypothetical protein
VLVPLENGENGPPPSGVSAGESASESGVVRLGSGVNGSKGERMLPTPGYDEVSDEEEDDELLHDDGSGGAVCGVSESLASEALA